MAMFREETGLLNAARAVSRGDFRIHDVYGPYPVHHLDEVLERKSRLPWITLGGGIAGLLAGIALQFHTTVLDWPMNIGGKPDNSTLAFIPIIFELTILSAGLITLIAFFLRSRLFPGAPGRLVAAGVTDDTFVLVLRKSDLSFDWQQARELLYANGATEIRESEAAS